LRRWWGAVLSPPSFAAGAYCAAVIRVPWRRASGAAESRASGAMESSSWWSLEGGGYLVVHLGMTGRLLLGGPAGKHTHAS